MQPITNQAEQTIAFQQQRLSPYIPLIVKALVKTYALPLGSVFVANVFLNLFNAVVPNLFTGLLGSGLSLLVFSAVLYFSWRFAENRWKGRALFVTYATVGKARRTLQNEIDSDNPSDTAVQQTMSEYVKSADHFMETMHTFNLMPEIIKVD
jgi:hypothetical protein